MQKVIDVNMHCVYTNEEFRHLLLEDVGTVAQTHWKSCNIPDIFREKMSELFVGLDTVRVYIDDLLHVTKGSIHPIKEV